MLMLMAAFVLIDGSLLAVCSVFAALVHELSHLLALHILGKKIRSLSALGKGLALRTELLSYRDEAIVCAAGPLASLLLAGGAFVFGFSRIAFASFALFFLNVLPIYPLDAGRALFCLVSLKTESRVATRIVRAVSFIFLLPLSVLSVIILLRSGFNLSLLIICIYLLILQTGAFNIYESNP